MFLGIITARVIGAATTQGQLMGIVNARVV